ncbi:LacI family DNA-binding transcriptional regulator [Arenibaculum pallidiluteum]|uniref:LacI family DNA-binding transcriptional regulator n=1 Tax=Arenibaculum pallidiluteum TaxID=2812559 RepID=UPI001A956CBA|nr:LacI family DNA-binding transcriptional regulator [Arenibaculum pallidiluteum]
MERRSRITLRDVAREAGVSLATVDRVLNDRSGVRSKTAETVEAVMQRLGYRAEVPGFRRGRDTLRRLLFVLPEGGNSFMEILEAQVARVAELYAPSGVRITTRTVDVFDPSALASVIEEIGAGFDGVAVVALDHPRVRGAIDDLAASGVAVVTLVSDVPRSARRRFIGIDNSAAGRTAASLMGRFLPGHGGTVAVMAGSLALRDHAERLYGFGQVMSTEFPKVRVLPALEGRDDTAQSRALAVELLKAHPDLGGIYGAGAGTRGIAAALEEAGRAGRTIFIGHELTEHSRRFLLSGTMAAVINQDAGHEARSAVRVMLAALGDEPLVDDQERIRIDIFLRDNLP